MKTAKEEQDEFITIEYTYGVGLVGCTGRGTVIVEADCTDEEIEERIGGIVLAILEWSWEKKEKDNDVL